MIGVYLDLAAGQSINEFDVKLNYSAYGVIKALSPVAIDYSTNIFSSPNYQTAVIVECQDGRIIHGNACDSDEFVGTVHLAEALLSNSIDGPTTNTMLFTVRFNVTGTGQSIFTFLRANLVNPGPNPAYPNPQLIEVNPQGGGFGNNGVVAFFDYRPDTPPAIVQGAQVDFDASSSFNAYNITIAISSYAWNFGDGSTIAPRPGSSAYHTFFATGHHTVRLNVTDSKGETGSISRDVAVLLPLGNLTITVNDQMGNPLRSNAVVKIYNSTDTINPFASKRTNGIGVVKFSGLKPGPYFLTYTPDPGYFVKNGNSNETIQAGWETQDIVFLNILSQPADYSGWIFLGSLVAGLGVVSVAIVLTRRRESRKKLKRRVFPEKKASSGSSKRKL